MRVVQQGRQAARGDRTVLCHLVWPPDVGCEPPSGRTLNVHRPRPVEPALRGCCIISPAGTPSASRLGSGDERQHDNWWQWLVRSVRGGTAAQDRRPPHRTCPAPPIRHSGRDSTSWYLRGVWHGRCLGGQQGITPRLVSTTLRNGHRPGVASHCSINSLTNHHNSLTGNCL